MATAPRAVLITGASTGIGRATAELVAAAGFTVLAGMRKGAAGAPGVEPPAGCERLELDVTHPDDVAAAIASVAAACPQGLFALVNNAGMAPPGPLELTDPDELRQVLEVNTVAPLRMIQACLPLLRRGGGRIINMSSMNGTVAMPIVGAYCASKFALEALSDTLRMELRPWRIPVTVIRPGQVSTGIFTKAQVELDGRSQKVPAAVAPGYGPLFEQANVFNARGAAARTRAEHVARAVLRALRSRRPKSRYYVGADAIGLQIAKEWLPTRLLDWAMTKAMGLSRRADAATNGDEAQTARTRP